MSRTYTNRRYLDALQERVLVFDGAMGTSLQMQMDSNLLTITPTETGIYCQAAVQADSAGQ